MRVDDRELSYIGCAVFLDQSLHRLARPESAGEHAKRHGTELRVRNRLRDDRADIRARVRSNSPRPGKRRFERDSDVAGGRVPGGNGTALNGSVSRSSGGSGLGKEATEIGRA